HQRCAPAFAVEEITEWLIKILVCWSDGVVECCVGTPKPITSVLQFQRTLPMFEDLRGFLAHLETQGQLLRVKDEVGVKYEIAAGMRKTSDIEGPALLFENIRGFPSWRVLGELSATRDLAALRLGVPNALMLERYLPSEAKRIRPEIIESAPYDELEWKCDQVELSKLPIVTRASKDVGPDRTIGVQVDKGPQ